MNNKLPKQLYITDYGNERVVRWTVVDDPSQVATLSDPVTVGLYELVKTLKVKAKVVIEEENEDGKTKNL